MKRVLTLLCFVTSLLLTACSQQEAQYVIVEVTVVKRVTPTPTLTATFTQTATSTMTPTSTPTATFTHTSTTTSTPTRKPTLTPTRTPTRIPTRVPTRVPTRIPTRVPTGIPTQAPANANILWDQAKYYIGQSETVCGPVVDTAYATGSSSKPTFLNLGRSYPDPERFTALIWNEHLAEFPPHPENYYLGKTICVDGKIILYNGGPQIHPTSKKQITVQ